jgi:hypothetical protein
LRHARRRRDIAAARTLTGRYTASIICGRNVASGLAIREGLIDSRGNESLLPARRQQLTQVVLIFAAQFVEGHRNRLVGPEEHHIGSIDAHIFARDLVAVDIGPGAILDRPRLVDQRLGAGSFAWRASSRCLGWRRWRWFNRRRGSGFVGDRFARRQIADDLLVPLAQPSQGQRDDLAAFEKGHLAIKFPDEFRAHRPAVRARPGALGRHAMRNADKHNQNGQPTA